ncbi:SRPBCC family protein [Streptomyces niger]|uniref:SRPBCC family protein n=1 Tax=Streptomyces niger TaxID=66373 RepID=UPI0006998336|nr:SRPBCC family protein [Streptomyces niger]
MAVRHQLIARPPAAVWTVLEDCTRYGDWVVGPSDSDPLDDTWPDVGSTITYKLRLGALQMTGHTVVRRHEPPRWLELEAHCDPLGSARIALDIRPWGRDETLVVLDEHPLRGFGGMAHNFVLDALLQVRHRNMLKRLAKVVEGMPPEADAGGGGRGPTSERAAGR